MRRSLKATRDLGAFSVPRHRRLAPSSAQNPTRPVDSSRRASSCHGAQLCSLTVACISKNFKCYLLSPSIIVDAHADDYRVVFYVMTIEEKFEWHKIGDSEHPVGVVGPRPANIRVVDLEDANWKRGGASGERSTFTASTFGLKTSSDGCGRLSHILARSHKLVTIIEALKNCRCYTFAQQQSAIGGVASAQMSYSRGVRILVVEREKNARSKWKRENRIIG